MDEDKEDEYDDGEDDICEEEESFWTSEEFLHMYLEAGSITEGQNSQPRGTEGKTEPGMDSGAEEISIVVGQGKRRQSGQCQEGEQLPRTVSSPPRGRQVAHGWESTHPCSPAQMIPFSGLGGA
jgi:hypothetical protein